jgi:hypothetical protein
MSLSAGYPCSVPPSPRGLEPVTPTMRAECLGAQQFPRSDNVVAQTVAT